MFIDEITLHISAGKGGDGLVSWRHEKGKNFGGPSGGDGGNGGSVYLQGVRDIAKLSEYRFIKNFYAEDGRNGKGDSMHGRAGKDLKLLLPIGSVITNVETDNAVEVLSEEPVLFLKGGRGGYGNEHFKASTNQNPMQFTKGKAGQSGEFFVELKLVADVGLVGFPNAGKSSVLNMLTKAKAKVGSYQFTTLNPNLGDFYGYIIADIPGLIGGAAEGKGLGHKFLRHISRTKMLLHCVSSEEDDPLKSYKAIRDELGKYDRTLLEKPEAVLFTKTDLIDNKTLDARKKLFSKSHKHVLSVSIIDDARIKEFGDKLVKILREI